jgi:predicted Rossmann fold flavoprotein
LKAKNHQFELLVNWTGEFDLASMKTELRDIKSASPKKSVLANNLFQIPMRLWKSLGAASGITESDKWADLSNQKIDALATELTQGLFRVNGKSTNKDEFVTCGGLVLNQIDFKTMQSKLHEGLYFGGEVLDIDAITGGFNFQAAWTTAWIAAQNC